MTFRVHALMAAAFLSVSLAHAASTPDDVPSSQDHPLVSRFAGSRLLGYKAVDWDSVLLPTSAATAKGKLKDTVTLEGKVTRLVYVSPPGKSPLEVYRNYEQALSTAGFKKVFACEKSCDDLYSAWDDTSKPRDGLTWSSAHITSATGSTWAASSSVTRSQGRMLYGTLARKGQTAHVLLYSSVAAHEISGLAATFIEIVEPKPMQTGQVTVDAQALQSSLQTEGKIALYGLFFDTGKADIKPESKAQLDEMAKLLQAQPQLKVFIVGHTDNVGAFEANQSLSLARAQAVVAALSKAPYGIAASRLQAKGAANIAPLASNADEAGRSRNRRVELVLQ